MKNWMEVGHMLRNFILKSAQQEEALHRIRRSSPYSQLLHDYASDPLAGPIVRELIEIRLKGD
ncbi:unnamed protein product [Spirodela intermedia]|uniref:Uncharacterized protein n=1 Tax=Spirodela intermedia TaxID=51605 RepID=A0ABN7E9J3_SPIIN|nr:unnamed protein product [Spirodela intermedia]